MKHPVSVAELLELHRLGEVYLKWVATPFALSEDDLQELQEISDRYSINHSSALFAFQRQYQREMAVGVERTIDKAIEAIPGLAEALKMVPTTPLVEEPTAYEQFTAIQDSDGVLKPGAFADRPLSPAESQMLQEAMQADRCGIEEVRDHRQAAFQKATELRSFRKERDEALAEQLQEDNAVDREAQAAFRADQLRTFRAELDGEMSEAREIEILRDISNVDELTEEESNRLDYLVERQQLEQDTVISPRPNSISIPSGVVQDAITTGHIKKIK